MVILLGPLKGILTNRGRVYLRGRENVHKRYLIHVAEFNLALLMRSKYDVGTPKGWADEPILLVLVAQDVIADVTVVLLAIIGPQREIVPVAGMVMRRR
ncbi:hypothetical protein [Magnetofaba australis]|uniref:hypothetical protein n=1 Tax=Magnetofaba australis TaxID=1472297 RepID=UPI0011806D1B|nr:hypothetical protein [Magnetofaba australis]